MSNVVTTKFLDKRQVFHWKIYKYGKSVPWAAHDDVKSGVKVAAGAQPFGKSTWRLGMVFAGCESNDDRLTVN